MVLMEKHKGKRALAKLQYRWERNIEAHLTHIQSEGVDWICVTEDRERWQAFVSTMMNVSVS
jgi:hypothetical protein